MKKVEVDDTMMVTWSQIEMTERGVEVIQWSCDPCCIWRLSCEEMEGWLKVVILCCCCKKCGKWWIATTQREWGLGFATSLNTSRGSERLDSYVVFAVSANWCTNAALCIQCPPLAHPVDIPKLFCVCGLKKNYALCLHFIISYRLCRVRVKVNLFWNFEVYVYWYVFLCNNFWVD